MAHWYQISVAAELLNDAEAKALGDLVAELALQWGANNKRDVHVDSAVGRPAWVEHVRDCQVPDCPFPAEWKIEVAVNGGVDEYLSCGKHRHEVIQAAASSSDVAWGDAQVSAARV